MWRRIGYTAAGLFLMVQAVYIALRLYGSGSMLMLAGVSPALVAALALGLLLVIRNVRRETPPAPAETPENDSSTP
jgi:hypothetical protein